MLRISEKTLSRGQRLLVRQFLARELLWLDPPNQPGPNIHSAGLAQDYPGIEFIGLVGFDRQRQHFVLVELANPAEPVCRSGRTLSRREQEVLQLVAQGYTNFQIATLLTITENTVKSHLQNIFAKLKVQSRTEAAMIASQQGWVRA